MRGVVQLTKDKEVIPRPFFVCQPFHHARSFASIIMLDCVVVCLENVQMFLVHASLFGETFRPSDKPANAAAQNAVVTFNIDRINIVVVRVAKYFSSVFVNKFSAIYDFDELPVDQGILSEMIKQGGCVLHVSIGVYFKLLSECRRFKNCAHLPDDMIGNHVKPFTDGVSQM